MNPLEFDWPWTGEEVERSLEVSTQEESISFTPSL